MTHNWPFTFEIQAIYLQVLNIFLYIGVTTHLRVHYCTEVLSVICIALAHKEGARPTFLSFYL
jgi:hypothetical protein